MALSDTFHDPALPTATVSSQQSLLLSTSQKMFLWSILLGLFASRLFAMVVIPFTDTTEARYAEIARKMLETGDWITPQFEYGVPFWGKPPLHTWLSAAGMGAFGVNEFAARLPIFALACAVLALLYHWVRSEKGEDHALVSLAVLASSGMFFIASGVVMTDLALIAGTTLAMVGFWMAVNARSRASLWGHLFFVGLAIGLLAKGPLAILLTGVPLGLWIMFEGRWRDTLSRIPWVTGTLAMLAIAAPWYIAAEIKTPGFLRYFIIGEHFERFTVHGWKGDLYGSGHREPKGMIWLFGMLAFLPWTFCFLRPIMRWRQVGARFRADESGWGRYLLFWTLSPFLIFTAAGNILIPYALPAMPAAAVLLVQGWLDASGPDASVSRRTDRVFRFLTVGVVAVMTAFSVVYVVAPGLISKKSQKLLVTAVAEAAPPDTGELLYLNRRYYSAEFYTQGRARRVDGLVELQPYLIDDRRDFLASRSGSFRELPEDVRDRFELIGPFGRDLLFLEKPVGTLPPYLVRKFGS